MKITEKDPQVLFEKVKSMSAKELLEVTNAMEEVRFSIYLKSDLRFWSVHKRKIISIDVFRCLS